MISTIRRLGTQQTLQSVRHMSWLFREKDHQLEHLREYQTKTFGDLTPDEKSTILKENMYDKENKEYRQRCYNDMITEMKSSGIHKMLDAYVGDHKKYMPKDIIEGHSNIPYYAEELRNYLKSQFRNEGIIGKAFIIGAHFMINSSEQDFIDESVKERIRELESKH